MFCRKCGTKLEEDVKFCGNCGSEVIVIQNKLPQPIKEEIVYVKEEKLKSLASDHFILGVVFGTIVIAIGLIITLSTFI